LSDDQAEAVFIVGVHRSGTTLMRAILNSSSQIGVSNENHYLGHDLGDAGIHGAIKRIGDLHDDRVVDEVVEHVYDDVVKSRRWFRSPSRAWIWLTRNIPREEFRQRLRASDRKEWAVFETLMRAYADRHGKAIVGEKTPAHVRHGDTLLRWFPRGRVVHMLRDPRGIYVSDVRRRRLEPGSLPYRLLALVSPALAWVLLVQTTVAWHRSFTRMRLNARRHPGRYLVVRFEDLVINPESEIRRVCTFLGVDFEDAMLERIVVSYGHALGMAGFDAHAAERWRQQISRPANRWFRLWLGKPMRSVGYVT
jgi:hypothetical protein